MICDVINVYSFNLHTTLSTFHLHTTLSTFHLITTLSTFHLIVPSVALKNGCILASKLNLL